MQTRAIIIFCIAVVHARGPSRSCLCNTHIEGKTIPCQGGICHVPPYNVLRRGSKQFACGTIDSATEKKYFCIATDELDDEDSKCTYKPDKKTTFCVCRNEDFCNKAASKEDASKEKSAKTNRKSDGATPGFWDRGYIQSSEEDEHTAHNHQEEQRKREEEERNRRDDEERRRKEQERIDRDRYYEEVRRKQQQEEHDLQRQKQEIERQQQMLEEDARRRKLELEATRKPPSVSTRVIVEPTKTEQPSNWKPNNVDQFAPNQPPVHLWIPEIEPASMFAASTAVTTSYRRVTQPDMLPIPHGRGEYHYRTDRVQTTTRPETTTTSAPRTTTIDLMPGEDAWWLETRTIKPWLPWKDRQTSTDSTIQETQGTTTTTTTRPTTTPPPTTTTARPPMTTLDRAPALNEKTGWEEKVTIPTTTTTSTTPSPITSPPLYSGWEEMPAVTRAPDRVPWWEKTSSRPTYPPRTRPEFTEPDYSDDRYATTPRSPSATSKHDAHLYTKSTSRERARNAYRPTYEEDVKVEKPIWTKSGMMVKLAKQLSCVLPLVYYLVYR